MLCSYSIIETCKYNSILYNYNNNNKLSLVQYILQYYYHKFIPVKFITLQNDEVPYNNNIYGYGLWLLIISVRWNCKPIILGKPLNFHLPEFKLDIIYIMTLVKFMPGIQRLCLPIKLCIINTYILYTTVVPDIFNVILPKTVNCIRFNYLVLYYRSFRLQVLCIHYNIIINVN